jgi:hypothetical protein
VTPHTSATDRLCFVISGTWWVNSGENFESEAAVPVTRGRLRAARCAHTTLRWSEEKPRLTTGKAVPRASPGPSKLPPKSAVGRPYSPSLIPQKLPKNDWNERRLDVNV